MMTGIKKRDLKLSSVEIKPIDISEDVEAIQLSKNIRTFLAFFYYVQQYEDFVAAIKADEDSVLLPSDDDDLEEFVLGNTIDQLLNCKVKLLQVDFNSLFSNVLSSVPKGGFTRHNAKYYQSITQIQEVKVVKQNKLFCNTSVTITPPKKVLPVS
ncbi:hypothetical protein G6F56_007913 [Rhizopus delemar]|nr:hypothetical protein G6F56_007913 [Rhizopus delemar]